MDPTASDVIALTSVLGGFVVAIVIVLAIVRARGRKHELQAQVQTKLIERFESGTDLVSFLKSAEGREFVTGVQDAPRIATRERIIGSIRNAVIMFALGVGFLLIWFVDNNRGVMYPAAILMALGAGNLIAAFLSMRLNESLQQPGSPPAAARSELL